LLSVKMLKSTSPSSSSLDAANLSPGNLEPTVLGRLLTALPVRLDAGMLAIACAKQGLLREGATLAALMCTTPLPIESAFKDPTVLERRLRHFGGTELFASSPYGGGGGGYTGGNFSKPFADPDQVLEAHLGAVMAHCQWADALRCADPNARATHADRLRAATAEEEEDKATSHDSDNAGTATSESRVTTRATSSTKARRSAAAAAAAAEQDDDDDELSAEEGALYSEAVWCQQGGLSSVSLAAVADCAACVEAALLSDDLNPVRHRRRTP